MQINNETLKKNAEKIYIALHKPNDYVCTCSDPHASKTILDLIPKKFNLFPVGRLDKNSEGLIFLTNDGDFAYQLTHPKFNKEKEYYIKIKGKLSSLDITQIKNGITLPEYKTRPAEIRHYQENNTYSSLDLTIHEGKKRQIREIFRFLSHHVVYLKRIRIGNIQLEKLPKGKWRHLTPQEVAILKK